MTINKIWGLILTLLILSFSISEAATYTTITAGDWNTSSNWLSGNVPPTDLSNGDIINVNHNMTGIVTMRGNSGTINMVVANSVSTTFTTLRIENGIGMNVTGNLIVAANMTFSKGTHNISGTLDVGANLTIENNAVVNLNKADIAANLVLQNGVINISGVVNIHGNASLYNSGSFVNIANSGAFLVDLNLSTDNADINGEGVVGWGSINMYNNANFEGLGDRVIPPYNPYDLDGGPGVLPVTLTSFTAKLVDSSVVLNWSTSSEQNFDYFSLQRSSDGLHYQEIAQVKGHGNSKITRYYDYTDGEPYSGTSYYRLQSIDFDGYTEIFRPVYVTLTEGESTIAYPNPVTSGNKLFIRFQQQQTNSYQIKDLTGKIIFSSQVEENFDEIDFTYLTPGMYFLKVNEESLIKIIRQ